MTMSSPPAILSTEKLSTGQWGALLNLLADEDPVVYRMIRKKILSYGPAVADWLRPHTISSDPVLRRHALDIIGHFGRQRADDEFLAFCLRQGEEFDLEKGAWLLAQTAYPAINVEAYQALLDDYAGELRERIDPGASAKQILAVMNRYLFKEL